jgi:hypothetical protein
MEIKMTAVASISTWRPYQGKGREFLAVAAKAKKIHEKYGAKVRMFSSFAGAQPSTFGYVIEHPSWAAFGAFGEKMERDNEWTTFWADANAHPTADLVAQSVVSETPGF